ncbi:5982_t:CDS:2 [Rhizophagus irregularis]|nr:5982_t:CDS:2 [Rhizophagus irregularis]
MDELENNKLMDESKNNKLMDESENNDDLKQLTDIDDNNVFSILSDFISRTNNENISMKEILFRNTKEGRDRAIKRTQKKVYEFFNMIGGKDKMQIKSFSAEEISELSSDDIDYILAKLAIGEERKIRSVEIV